MSTSSDDSDFQSLSSTNRRSAHDLHVRVALLEQATAQVRQELHNINNNISKLVWAVITAVLVGILNMVIGQKDFSNVKVGISQPVESSTWASAPFNRTDFGDLRTPLVCMVSPSGSSSNRLYRRV